MVFDGIQIPPDVAMITVMSTDEGASTVIPGDNNYMIRDRGT